MSTPCLPVYRAVFRVQSMGGGWVEANNDWDIVKGWIVGCSGFVIATCGLTFECFRRPGTEYVSRRVTSALTNNITSSKTRGFGA